MAAPIRREVAAFQGRNMPLPSPVTISEADSSVAHLRIGLVWCRQDMRGLLALAAEKVDRTAGACAQHAGALRSATAKQWTLSRWRRMAMGADCRPEIVQILMLCFAALLGATTSGAH